VIERVPVVFLDDWTLGVKSQDFQSAAESVHKAGEKEERTSLEKAGRRRLEIIEDTGDNETHNEVADEGTKCQTRIANQASPSTPQAKLRLLDKRQRKRRLGTLPLSLLCFLGSAEGLGVGPVDGMVKLVGLDLVLENLVVGAVPPGLGKFVRGARRPALKARSYNTLLRARHGCEEVGCGCASRALKSEIDKILLRIVGPAEEDLAAFVQYNDLVKEVVSTLRCLVDRNAGGASKKFGLQPQVANELDSIGAVQASGTVIPALERSARERGLGDSDTLSLTSRDTTDVLVSDTGVDSVADAEQCHDNIPEVVGKKVLGDTIGDLARGTSVGSKGQSISDRKLRKMGIDLGSVDGLSAVLRVHFIGGHTFDVSVQCEGQMVGESVFLTHLGS